MEVAEWDPIDQSCCFHLDSVTDSPLIRLNSLTWKKIRVCAMKWLQLEVKAMKDMASRLVNGRHHLYSSASFPRVLRLHPALSTCICHVDCFKQFTDEDHIQQLVLQSGRGDNDAGMYCNKTDKDSLNLLF